jgi:hypothetical protein
MVKLLIKDIWSQWVVINKTIDDEPMSSDNLKSWH